MKPLTQHIKKHLEHNSKRVLWVLLGIGLFSGNLQACLPSPKLSELAALVTQKVYQIKQARIIAAEAGYSLATFGGTSREVIRFICNEVEKKGLDPFEKDLRNSDSKIELVDFHKLNSDLDIMLIVRDPRLASEDSASSVMGKITQMFPGTLMYKKMDINESGDFFSRHPIYREHFEPTSTLPITERGVERLGELKIKDGVAPFDNFSDWGLWQFSNKEFQFRFNPQATDKTPAYGMARQLLRWVRYLSEEPTFKLDSKSRDSMFELLRILKEKHYPELLALLEQGDEELVGKRSADSLGAKLVEAIEKIQLYSYDTEKTSQLLKEFQITEWLADAGIAEGRLLVPIPERSKITSSGHQKKLGKSVIVQHYGPLAAIQSMSQGALYASNNRSIIAGTLTADAYQQEGIYAAENHKSKGHGGASFFVEIALNPEAIEGVDYYSSGDVYIIKTKNAIAKNPDGSLKISKVSHASIVEGNIEKFFISKDSKDRSFALRSVFEVLQPFENKEHASMVMSLRKRAESGGLLKDFDSQLRLNPEHKFEAFFFMEDLKRRYSADQKKLFDLMLKEINFKDLKDISHEILDQRKRLEQCPECVEAAIARLVTLIKKDPKHWELGSAITLLMQLIRPELGNAQMQRYLNIMNDMPVAAQERMGDRLAEEGFYVWESVFRPDSYKGLKHASLLTKYAPLRPLSLMKLTPSSQAEQLPRPKLASSEFNTGLAHMKRVLLGTKDHRIVYRSSEAIVWLFDPFSSVENFRALETLYVTLPDHLKKNILKTIYPNKDYSNKNIVRFAFGVFPLKGLSPSNSILLSDLQKFSLNLVEEGLSPGMDSDRASYETQIKELMPEIKESPLVLATLRGQDTPLKRILEKNILDWGFIQEGALPLSALSKMHEDTQVELVRELRPEHPLAPSIFSELIRAGHPGALLTLAAGRERYLSLLSDDDLKLLLQRGGPEVVIEAVSAAMDVPGYESHEKEETKTKRSEQSLALKKRIQSWIPWMEEIAIAGLDESGKVNKDFGHKILIHQSEVFSLMPNFAKAVARSTGKYDMYRFYSKDAVENFSRSKELLEIFLERASLTSLMGLYEEIGERPSFLMTMPDLKERIRLSFERGLESATDFDLRLIDAWQEPHMNIRALMNDYPQLKEQVERLKASPFTVKNVLSRSPLTLSRGAVSLMSAVKSCLKALWGKKK